MGIVLLESQTHSLLRETLKEKSKRDNANYTNSQIIKLGLLKLKEEGDKNGNK